MFINGETAHSKGLFKSGSISREKEIEEINQWSKLYMHIRDEIRMTGQALFCKAYKRIRKFSEWEKSKTPENIELQPVASLSFLPLF